MKIGFMFNHYMGHQVFHAAPVAFAMSVKYPDVAVTIMVSDSRQLEAVRRVEKQWPTHSCTIKMAHVVWWVKLIEKLLVNYVFIRKHFVLRQNKAFFKGLDVLVVPENNSLALKKDPDLSGLKLVRIRHGAGDRDVSFGSNARHFDLTLVAGNKYFERLQKQAGVKKEKLALVGYPKFDVIGKRTHKILFENDNPTVLYNPHFKNGLSSWQDWGKSVLDFFVANPQYNLIVAPHVILYLRKWRHKAFSLKKYQNIPNIHIDTGSPKCIDMTYTEQADIYLGDVSSQVYEFLSNLRPCIFLNPHGYSWQNDPNFLMWHFGDVVDTLDHLPEALENAKTKHKKIYKKTQQKFFNETFDITDEPSSFRAADAIVDKFALKALRQLNQT